jgi:hypothetical protein
MTQTEFNLINSLASQLQHFVDRDGLEAPAYQQKLLLDLAEEMLSAGRGQLIRERDFGHSQSAN